MKIKPDLKMYFAAMPIIGVMLNEEYKQANTIEQLADLFYRWKDREEASTNPLEVQWLKAASNYIYSYFTNRSFETKKYESL